MKILVLFSGSQGHYRGVQRFLASMSLKEDIVYASHLGIPEEQKTCVKYLHLNAPPAFLDYEFIHHKDLKEIIKLKSDKVYYHRRKQALQKLISTINPDVILFDNHSYTDALILAELNRQADTKILFYQTRLSTALTNGSFYGGHKNLDVKFLSASLILRRKKLRSWRKKITMPGINENHHIRNLIKSLSFNYVGLNKSRSGLDSLSYVPELILSGSSLSFYQADNQIYTGLWLSKLPSIIEKNKDTPSILVSSGSRSHTYLDYPIFLDTIKRLVNLLPHIAFSLPESFKAKVYGDHITYYQWNTYLNHLAQSNLHITHGGINSIKDSLSHELPMLICPLDWRSDQINNALMFEKLGLASIWNIKKDNIKNVKEKTDALLQDFYPVRIREYVVDDRKKYPLETMKEQFMELVRDRRWEIRNW